MSSNLSIFAPTADQRFLLGSELFLRTHYPMTMRSYSLTGQLAMQTESDLLQLILEQDKGLGNRVWVLYGAPGSGKSELIKWLETRIIQEDSQRSQVVVRISRHELDVLSIANRFLTLLPNQFMSEATTQRWTAARQKSRTVTKLILLFALENLLDSDELINALFYRLLNVIQPYVDRILAIESDEIDGQSCVELIGQEAWSAILRETALPIPIEYEQFRHQLTVAFRDHLLQGLSLADTMQRISKHCQVGHGQRPVLLVDDLVQSLNIFATDLLDYILTLEAGNWDVVLGLTPAAFEDSQRGRGLLQRIAHLDTIDDRVQKIWLSDETGKESYVLTEANCDAFAARYLAEIDTTYMPGFPLFPFTREVLVRIYRALPAGKGKVRYFIRYLHEILQRVSTGEEILQILMDFIQPEYIARVEDTHLARLCEFYGPLLQPESSKLISLPKNLLTAFSITAEQAKIPIEPLVRFYQQREIGSEIIEDESQLAVRDWLLGKPVNRQILKPLRQGAARWLRTVQPIDRIYRDHMAKPRGALRWRKTLLGVSPPICLEGIDEGQDGIALTRDIGMIAFDLCQYATATGVKFKTLQEHLAAEKELALFQLTADSYRLRLQHDLEMQLGMKTDLLALMLQTFVWVVKGENGRYLPGFSSDFWQWVGETRKRYRWQADQFNDKTWQAFQFLFDDFFELRKELYDGVLVRQLLAETPYETWFSTLCQIDVQQIDKDYLLEGRPLANVLGQVQRYIQQCEQVGKMVLSEQTNQVLVALRLQAGVPMVEIAPDVLAELKMLSPNIYAALRVRLE